MQQQFCELYYLDTHPKGEEHDLILLFVHGNISSSAYWEPLCLEISKSDPRIRQIRVDIRGCGRSQSLKEVNQIMDFAQDINNFVVTVLQINESQALQRLILVGWSLGSMICMQLGAQWPNCYRKMILISSGPLTGNPVMTIDQSGYPSAIRCKSKDEIIAHPRIAYVANMLLNKDTVQFQAISDAALFNSGKKPSDKEMDHYMAETFLQTNYTDTVWAAQEFDISQGKADTAKQIQGPVLVIHGKLDLLINFIHAEGIVQEIGEQKCKLLTKDDLSHMIPLEDPINIAQDIVQFIRQ